MTPDEGLRMSLEAFADTVIPGDKRWPGDRAVAGVSADGGAVAAGAVELMSDPAGGLADVLDSMMESLNDHAEQYASQLGLASDDSVPAFVGLPFPDRTALVERLTAPDHPEKELFVALLMFSNMAFDTGAHLHTVGALAASHPGLTLMGFRGADQDGLWRFAQFSYGRQLADPHPHTTATGDPA